jgi:hypothetical protein
MRCPQVFSSMGAGAKSDPTRVQIADIANTVYDPLARAVRQRLRRLGVPAGVPVVYSTEVPGEVGLLPLPEEEFKKGKVGELGVLDEWRVRILPVLGALFQSYPALSTLSLPAPTRDVDENRKPLPAIFGLHIATYVLSELAGKPLANPLVIKNRRKLYERMLRDLQAREAKRAGTLVGYVRCLPLLPTRLLSPSAHPLFDCSALSCIYPCSTHPHPPRRIPLDEDDVALLFEDVHRGRSVVPPRAVPVKPTLVRWDPARPLGVENVVVMDARVRRRRGRAGRTWVRR